MLKIIVCILGIIVLIEAVTLFNLAMTIDQINSLICTVPNEVGANLI